MTSPHERRCFDCGNVAVHADAIVPHVLCTECGSQDTRIVRKKGTDDGPKSVAAEIAVAVAGVRSDDYWGMLAVIEGVLDRFGIEHMQRARA